MKQTLYTLFRKTLACVATAFACASLASCDGWIYQDEGDCEPHYKVKFRYDYTLKGENAFSSEVEAVTLYIVDPETGNVVWRKTESSDTLKAEDYAMDIEGLAPGNYKLMAWAGQGHLDSPHFSLNDSGDDHTSLLCTINREHDADGNAVVDDRLHNLYKDLPQEFAVREFPDRQGTHVQTVRLMKNTNHITVVLQQLSGEPVDASAFDFEITDDNGLMNYNNALLPDETLTYKPNNVRNGLATGFVPENGAEASFVSAIANFAVGRMLTDHAMILTVRRHSTGELILRVPVIDNVLLGKYPYERYPDQEYLDRQDQYSMVFFLDEGLRWINSEIYINAWKVVPVIVDL